MLHHRQHDGSKALYMLGLALDVAGRLEDKIQLSCEVYINKAEVCCNYKTINKRKKEPEQEDTEETSGASVFREGIAG